MRALVLLAALSLTPLPSFVRPAPRVPVIAAGHCYPLSVIVQLMYAVGIHARYGAPAADGQFYEVWWSDRAPVWAIFHMPKINGSYGARYCLVLGSAGL